MTEGEDSGRTKGVIAPITAPEARPFDYAQAVRYNQTNVASATSVKETLDSLLVCHSCESRNPVSFVVTSGEKPKTLDPRLLMSGITDKTKANTRKRHWILDY